MVNGTYWKHFYFYLYVHFYDTSVEGELCTVTPKERELQTISPASVNIDEDLLWLTWETLQWETSTTTLTFTSKGRGPFNIWTRTSVLFGVWPRRLLKGSLSDPVPCPFHLPCRHYSLRGPPCQRSSVTTVGDTSPRRPLVVTLVVPCRTSPPRPNPTGVGLKGTPLPSRHD